MHPGVIEACFQVLRCCREFESARLFKETGDVYVPFSIERFRFHRRPESHRLWCHATIREPARRDGQNVTGDLCLCDENGNLVAEIIGFEQRKLKKDILLRHLARDPSEWLYQLGWKTATLPERPAAETGGTPGTWLVFSDEAGVGRELASLLIDRGDRTVLVSAGSTYERIDAFNYCLDSDAPDQLRRLLDDCTQEHGRPDKGVVYLWGLAGAREEELSLDSLQQAQGVSYGGGLSLVQAMASELWSPNPRIWLVTRGTQPVGQDETRDLVNAPLWGLGRVVALEHPELGCTMLDLPPAVSVPDDAQCLFDELVSASREDQIAYRDGVRSAARLVRHSPTTPVRGQCPVHRDATYLVTGGLGGLGLEVAKWLVASGARHLLLVGRRAPSEPAARMIEAMEQVRPVPSAWIPLFSSTQNTTALAGGFRYSPTTSRSFSTKWGSDSLNCPTRWGWRPCCDSARARLLQRRLHLRQGQAGAPARTRGVAEHARHPLGHKPARPQPHRHPTDVQRPGHDHRRDLLRQHQHDPRPPRHLLRRRPALSHLGQLGVLGRRCVDTVPLKEHALPYQTGSAKSVSCTAISYSGH